jgi:parvulin-like peptidyl-prolyl isomerase
LKRYVSALLICSISLVFSACASAPDSNNQTNAQAANPANSQDNTNGNAAQSQPTAVPVTPTDEPLAAKVNGKPIPLSVLEREVTRRIDGINALGDPMPADMNAYRQSVLDSLIDQLLIEDAAAVQNVVVTDADLEKEIQENITLAGSKEKWSAQLAADRMTEAEYRIGLRSALITGKMRDIVTASVGMTADQVHARHILVDSEATANEVVTKLKGGTDFAALALQYSLDTSTRNTGGDLGWFAKGMLLEASVEDAAFALKDNETSQPVKSNLGYHIIQTLEHAANRPISPDTHYKLSAKVFDAWIQSLEKNAKIEKFI